MEKPRSETQGAGCLESDGLHTDAPAATDNRSSVVARIVR